MLDQGSIAMGSLTRRVKPERLARQNGNDNYNCTIIAKNDLGPITCKACMNIPAVRLCADRVRCQPEVSMVTE